MAEDTEAAKYIPFRLASCTVDGITNSESFEPVYRYLNNMTKYLHARVGLLLSGPNGCGKSGALAAISNYVKTNIAPVWGSRHVVWCRATDIATTYGYPGKHDATFDMPVDQFYETAKWLVIDELGRERETKNFDNRMVLLLGKRASAGLITHFTTNLNLDTQGPGDKNSVEGVYGPAFMSLLHQSCLLATVSGEDRRKTGH